MSILSRLTSIFSSSQTVEELNTRQGITSRKPVARQLQRYNYRIDASMKKWKEAVQSAEDHFMPRREVLYLLYHTIMEDDALLGQVRTARFNIQMSDYEIHVDGVNQEDIVKAFDTPWFYRYLELAVDAEMHGYSLIEMIPGKDGFISDIDLIPREHTAPWKSQVLIRPGDINGIPYDKGPLARRLIGIGHKQDLGLLKSISKLVIRKDYNLVDWGRRNERFGMPLVWLKTDSIDKAELDAKEEMLKNFGANLYGMTNTDDEIDIKEPLGNTGAGHKSYLDYIEYLDKCIAISVNGQTSTSEQTAYVGSAEVQERQLNKFTLARMRRIQYHINHELFPWLAMHHNYPVENATFQFLDLMKNESDTVIDEDNTDTEIEKKKS